MIIRDHQRASLAFEHVRAVAERPKKAQEKYRSMCLKLPTLVHTQGLGPALHFVAARGEAEQRLVLEHIDAQLGQAGLLDAKGTPGAARLLSAVRRADLAATQALTRETQRVLTWYKRFVQAELRTEEGDRAGGGQ